MRILSISLDRTILDLNSPAAKRQVMTYAGHEALIVVVTTGEMKDVELAPNVHAKTFGGASKFGAFMHARSWLRRAERPDVVTAQEPIYTALLASRVTRRMKCGLLIQDHSGMFARRPASFLEWILRPYAKHLLRKANRVRTVSERGKRGLVSIGIAEEKIDVIPIATDITRYSLLVSRDMVMQNQIICVSRLEPEKGIGVLLSAFSLLRASHPEAALVIVGDGSQRATLEKLARSMRIADAVLFAGKTDDVRPFLSRAAIFVQPSYFEGWGLAVIEAAAAGMPIVMTDVGCAGEVIKNGESGLVVPTGDVRALSNALGKLLGDAALRQSLGEAARRAVVGLPGPDATAQAIRTSLERALKVSP